MNMSNSLVMGGNVLAFMPIDPEEARIRSRVEKQKKIFERKFEAWKSEARVEMNAEYEARVEREVQARVEREVANRLPAEVEPLVEVERQKFNQAMDQCTANFDVCITAMRKDIQKKVLDLSISLAEVIVRHELPDRDMLRNLMVKTLEPVSDLQGVVVRVSSSDWELFGDSLSNGEHLGIGGTVKFAEDPNLSSGDVIVESRNGIFDARLDERLKLLKEMLNERSGRALTQSSEL
jgi:flagellar biosynthesis/type III secretory pathway protein FliH